MRKPPRILLRTLLLGALVLAIAEPLAAQSLVPPYESVPPGVARPPSDTASADSRTAIRNAFLTDAGSSLAPDYSGIDSALAFYAARDFQPAWTASETDRQMAQLAISAIAGADEQGLRAEDYKGDWAQPPSAPAGIVQYELTLTHAVLRYARDLRLGRADPARVYKDAAFAQDAFSASDGLNAALRNRALTQFFTNLPPPNGEYRALLQELARYRAIEARGGWEILPPLPAGLKVNSRDPFVALLARRLAAEDARVLALAQNPDELSAALKRFQTRNAIKPSGEMDAETLAALNRPVKSRILQIMANLERWRWLPRNFERQYIAVNVPAQTAQFFRDGRAVLSSKVVIGRNANPTPLLRTEITSLVVNPPWNIPGFISARDILPRLKKDRRYLQAKNMMVVDGPEGDPYGLKIDWAAVSPDAFHYSIRQMPGPATALGQLMLDSPNDFDVYLHDTPNKEYFAREDRGLSNGCVRVENVFDFAALALQEPGENGRLDEIKRALNLIVAAKDTQRIALKSPVPVYLLYWTAFTGEDGTLNFRDDRYGRDTALFVALDWTPQPRIGEAPFQPSAEALAAMQEDITP